MTPRSLITPRPRFDFKSLAYDTHVAEPCLNFCQFSRAACWFCSQILDYALPVQVVLITFLPPPLEEVVRGITIDHVRPLTTLNSRLDTYSTAVHRQTLGSDARIPASYRPFHAALSLPWVFLGDTAKLMMQASRRGTACQRAKRPSDASGASDAAAREGCWRWTR